MKSDGPARLDQAGGMDDRVGAVDQALQRCLVREIAQHHVGLDAGERGQRRPAADQQAELPAATGQGGNEVRADEAGGAGDRDQPAHEPCLRPRRSWARRGRRDNWPWCARATACPTRSSAGRPSAAPARRRNRPPPPRAPRRATSRASAWRASSPDTRASTATTTRSPSPVSTEKAAESPFFTTCRASIAHSMSCGQTLRPLTMIRSLARPVTTISPSSV